MREQVDQRHVIICFSPRDRQGKDELARHLAAARRSIRVWSVDDVPAGGSVLPAFVEETEKADAALLLLSANFCHELGNPMFAGQVDALRQQQQQRGMWVDALIWRRFIFDEFFELTGLKLPWRQKPPNQMNALTAMGTAQRDEAIVKLVHTLLISSSGLLPFNTDIYSDEISSREIVVRREFWSASSSILHLRIWISLLPDTTMPRLSSGGVN